MLSPSPPAELGSGLRPVGWPRVPVPALRAPPDPSGVPPRSLVLLFDAVRSLDGRFVVGRDGSFAFGRGSAVVGRGSDAFGRSGARVVGSGTFAGSRAGGRGVAFGG